MDTAAPVVTDSAGARLVDYAGALPSAPVSPELVWEHGLAAGDYLFQIIFRADLQPDGGAVVGDPANREVVLIAPDGTNRGLLASSGQGPGEVMAPRSIVVLGQDTVWVEDSGTDRLMLFEGGAVATTVNASTVGIGGLMPIGADAGGALLMTTSRYRPGFEQPWLVGHLVRFDPRTPTVDTVGSYDMVPRTPETGWNPYAAFGNATVAGHRFVHVRSDVPSVVWRGAAGDVAQIVRWRPQPEYPSDELWRSFETSLRSDLERVNPQLSGDALEEFLDGQVSRYEVDPSLALPLFGQAVGTASGAVWLPAFAPRGTRPTTYAVVSPDGSSAASVVFPRPFTVLSVAEPSVLGVFEGELGVQAVAVYRFGMPW